MWLGSMLLWHWRRPVATALIRPLAWEPPYAVGAAQEIAKRQKKKKKKKVSNFQSPPKSLFMLQYTFISSFLAICCEQNKLQV